MAPRDDWFEGPWDGWQDDWSYLLLVQEGQFFLNFRRDTNHSQDRRTVHGAVTTTPLGLELQAQATWSASDGPSTATPCTDRWSGHLTDLDGRPLDAYPSDDEDPSEWGLTVAGLGFFTRAADQRWFPTAP